MSQARERERPIKEETEPEIGQKTLVKKSYVSPQLVEYGSIAKLTQGPAGTGTEGTFARMSCL